MGRLREGLKQHPELLDYLQGAGMVWHVEQTAKHESSIPTEDVVNLVSDMASVCGDLKVANRLLEFFIRDMNRDAIIGDLLEEYNVYILPNYGVRYAKFWYWWHAAASAFAILVYRISTFIAGRAAWLGHRLGF